MVKCATRASDGPNRLGLCALTGRHTGGAGPADEVRSRRGGGCSACLQLQYPCCPSNASVGKARLGRGAGEGGRGAQGGAACTEAQQLLVESNGLCAIHGLDLAPSSFRGPLLEFFNSTNGIPRGMYCSDYLFKLLLIGDSGVGKSVSVTCSMCQRIERCWHGALIRPAFHIWVDPVQSANSACCCDSRTTPTRRATSPPSVSTSKFGPSIWMVRPTVRCRVCLFARSG